MKKTIIVLICLLSAACINQPTQKPQKQIKQGVTGQVIWLEGNLMPTIDGPDTKAREGKPVAREIHIYKLINVKDTESNGGFFTKVKGTPVKKTQSDQSGHFSIQLPVGEYSIFVKEAQGLYANLFDGNNYINPIVVNKDKITEIKLKIDYKALY